MSLDPLNWYFILHIHYSLSDNNAKRARGKLPQPRKKSSQTENDDVATKEVVSPKSIEKGQEKKAPSSIPRSSIPTANKRSWKNETTPVRRIPSTSSKAKIEKQHSILSEASTASIETEKVRELEAKCENYENQINLLKSEFRRKNLALEAFTAVVNHYLSVVSLTILYSKYCGNFRLLRTCTVICFSSQCVNLD